jgi:hypothetical protein
MKPLSGQASANRGHSASPARGRQRPTASPQTPAPGSAAPHRPAPLTRTSPGTWPQHCRLSQVCHESSAGERLDRLAPAARGPRAEALRQIMVQNFLVDTRGNLRSLTDKDGRPRGALKIASPYDLEARWAIRGDARWTGYLVHVTETCDADDSVNLITDVATTGPIRDSQTLPDIHARLSARRLLPAEHLVDSGYVTQPCSTAPPATTRSVSSDRSRPAASGRRSSRPASPGKPSPSTSTAAGRPTRTARPLPCSLPASVASSRPMPPIQTARPHHGSRHHQRIRELPRQWRPRKNNPEDLRRPASADLWSFCDNGLPRYLLRSSSGVCMGTKASAPRCPWPIP